MRITTEFRPDPNHWAYQEGRAAGIARDTTRRGIMAFGLGFAATALDALNTRQWLAGFDSAQVNPPAASTAPAANEYGDHRFA